MQTHRNLVPIILAAIAGLVVIVICAATLFSIGALAWLLPVRTVSTQVEVVEATVPVGVTDIPSTVATETSTPPIETATSVPSSQPGFTDTPGSGSPARIVYVAPDGNLWLLDLPAITPRQLTEDATPLMSPEPSTIMYNEPRLSSDGRFAAYRRGDSTGQADNSIDFGLWVLDLETGDAHEIYDMSPSGYAWQPGTHLLAYIPELQGDYFSMRGEEPDSSFANPIMGYDADSEETQELVEPEGGYAMYNPAWSPDGRFLSFDEVLYMEGRGPFAYYDFSNGQYISLGEPLGVYSWSPDGELLAHDNMTYIATGEERIFIRPRQDGTSTQFSPATQPGYAIIPTFSPQGDRIAYLVNSGEPDSQLFTLTVQPYPQGEPVALGEFESVYVLSWTPDGSQVIFSAGPWDNQWVYAFNVLTLEVQQLQQGVQPAVSAVP